MKRKRNERLGMLGAGGAFLALLVAFLYVLWEVVPSALDRWVLLGLGGGILLILYLWTVYIRRKIEDFSDQICVTLDDLIGDREPEHGTTYGDSLDTKIEGKLLKYYDVMRCGREESQKDKQIIQELVSDISHQVKTPIANAKMFTQILQERELNGEKRKEFLYLLEGQVEKLEFLMKSLIKMSRLETGTFALHMEQRPIYDTIAQAVSSVWVKAEEKKIELSVDCDSSILVKHDEKWTAEALTNILDNAVKYTNEGGTVTIQVRPWQFYTRINIVDTGIGIGEKDYHKIFKRFYRASEVAAKEGVGLGLYLAQGIITRQKGYISIKSKKKVGSTFSVHLLS